MDDNLDKIIIGLQAMSKDELVKFAANAIESIERLETSNDQFKSDLEASGTIDTAIIWQWREWLDAVDKERDTWAVLATKLSEENKAIKAENKKLLDRSSRILEMLDKISIHANVQVDGNKPPSFLLGVIDRIKKSINNSKSALIEFVVDEPIIETREPEPQLPPKQDAIEQPPDA